MTGAARLTAFVALAAGCAADGIAAPLDPVLLDPHAFRCRAQPVLVARCAFFACHGSARRAFRVYAPQRLRWDVPEDARELPLTTAEEQANFDMARGFADDTSGEPPILGKPLAVEVGGSYHQGASLYGGEDVFSDPGDPGLSLLAEWVGGGTAPDDCIPTEKVGL